MTDYYSWNVCPHLYFEVCWHFFGVCRHPFFGMLTSLLFVVETWSFTISLLNHCLDTLLWGTLRWTDDWLLFLERMSTSLFWGMTTSFFSGMSTSFFCYAKICFGGMSTSFFCMLTSLFFVETWSFTISLLNNCLDALLRGTLRWTDD